MPAAEIICLPVLPDEYHDGDTFSEFQELIV